MNGARGGVRPSSDDRPCEGGVGVGFLCLRKALNARTSLDGGTPLLTSRSNLSGVLRAFALNILGQWVPTENAPLPGSVGSGIGVRWR